MSRHAETDYQTYKEIVGELLQPIAASGLPDETLKRLYESKLVYLENLRVKCFREVNDAKLTSSFQQSDYELILTALKQTRAHLRDAVVTMIQNNLNRRKVG